MDEHLPEVFGGIVSARTDDEPVLEIDPLGHFPMGELQRSRLSAYCQKLQQVRDTHRRQIADNSHFI